MNGIDKLSYAVRGGAGLRRLRLTPISKAVREKSRVGEGFLYEVV